MKRLNIIILGYVVRGPIGGMTWHHLQYCLGLRKLGHRVFFVEDSGNDEYCCYDPSRHVTDSSPSYGLNYAKQVFDRHRFESDWCYFDKHSNQWYGPLAASHKKIFNEADVLINISMISPVRQWMERIPVRIVIDTDPVFTQIRNLKEKERKDTALAHTHFFTFGENYGQPFCTIPSDGIQWRPTRQPVAIDEWRYTPGDINAHWTTIMVWESYRSQSYEGKSFGMKSVSFREIAEIPRLLPDDKLEIGLGKGPEAELSSNGWIISNPLEPTKDPWKYASYISSSKGEFSVAKHGYVTSNSGWFSERSACYLASGRPVIVQDTGFSKFIDTGSGLLTFRSREEAVANFKLINGDYQRHCIAARGLCEEYFESGKVLRDLLSRV